MQNALKQSKKGATETLVQIQSSNEESQNQQSKVDEEEKEETEKRLEYGGEDEFKGEEENIRPIFQIDADAQNVEVEEVAMLDDVDQKEMMKNHNLDRFKPYLVDVEF